MLNFFKKKNKFQVMAVANGKTLDITKVNDPIFSQKMMGEGIAIVLDGNDIYAPCAGEITVLPESKHAFGMKCENGMEILVHVGIDTVNLQGEGFEAFKAVGDHVDCHDKILSVDRELVASKGIDLTTMIIILNHADFKIDKMHTDKDVKASSDPIIDIG